MEEKREKTEESFLSHASNKLNTVAYIVVGLDTSGLRKNRKVNVRHEKNSSMCNNKKIIDK